MKYFVLLLLINLIILPIFPTIKSLKVPQIFPLRRPKYLQSPSHVPHYDSPIVFHPHQSYLYHLFSRLIFINFSIV
jgi:hypothetical protein